jgi:hypothetical protein
MSLLKNHQFYPTSATAQVDSDGKLTVGMPLRQESTHQNYRILINDAGQILLDPFANIPEQERWLWENPEALASLGRGLQQAADGDVRDLGSFAQYADLELDD